MDSSLYATPVSSPDIFLTPNRRPLETFNRSFSNLETPVGDHNDQRPRIQLCLELRALQGKRSRKELQLDVVVLNLKNIINNDSGIRLGARSAAMDSNNIQGTPKNAKQRAATIAPLAGPLFVKVSFDEGRQLSVTELKKQDPENLNTIFFAEPFAFPISYSRKSQEDERLLSGKSLLVEVCNNKKLTRSARRLGSIEIPLDSIYQVGKPIVKWYHLS